MSLCALTAGWMLFMWRLHPAWRTRVPHVVVFVVGLQLITLALVIWEALALGSGWFGFLVAVCFAYSRALPRLSWQLAGASRGRVHRGLRADRWHRTAPSSST